MTPEILLQHDDTGELWPQHGGNGMAELAAAYASSLAVRALRIARGKVPCGYKVGFTNRTIWPRYNAYAPIWGTMWNTTVSGCEDQGRLSLAHLCQPRIEPETVFGFAVAPAADAGLDGLFEALDWVAPGFEIVQSHGPTGNSTPRRAWPTTGCTGGCWWGTSSPSATWHATPANCTNGWPVCAGELWTARFDSVLPVLEVRFV